MVRRVPKVLFVVLFFSLAIPGLGQRPAPASSGFTILLTNDDGYDAPGLKALIEAFRSVGDLYVVAPAENQSGKGHSIATSEPILVSERKQPNGVSWYAVEAPPATCARLAIESLLPKHPDVVISGINRGENLGIVVYYSGTLGAAREAAIVGIPAIAVSIDGNNAADYAAAADYTRQLVEQLRAQQRLEPGLFLNVNVPAGERKGVRITRLSVKATGEFFERRVNPRGRTYFWSDWKPLGDDEEGTDVWAFVRGYITVTPMVLDVTETKGLDVLRPLETRASAALR